MLNLAGYRALTGHTVRQSIGLLSAASVVICEDILPDGTWKDLLAALDRVHSPTALVVTSAAVEPRLWAEVLNLGGTDVLAQPFSNEEVLWIVQRAVPAGTALPTRCNADRPVEPNSESRMELPENGHRCALMGTHRHAASETPRISFLNHHTEAPSGWTGTCSLSTGSQRSNFKR
jgi:hypothetical protein